MGILMGTMSIQDLAFHYVDEFLLPSAQLIVFSGDFSEIIKRVFNDWQITEYFL